MASLTATFLLSTVHVHLRIGGQEQFIKVCKETNAKEFQLLLYMEALKTLFPSSIELLTSIHLQAPNLLEKYFRKN